MKTMSNRIYAYPLGEELSYKQLTRRVRLHGNAVGSLDDQDVGGEADTTARL